VHAPAESSQVHHFVVRVRVYLFQLQHAFVLPLGLRHIDFADAVEVQVFIHFVKQIVRLAFVEIFLVEPSVNLFGVHVV